MPCLEATSRPVSLFEPNWPAWTGRVWALSSLMTWMQHQSRPSTGDHQAEMQADISICHAVRMSKEAPKFLGSTDRSLLHPILISPLVQQPQRWLPSPCFEL